MLTESIVSIERKLSKYWLFVLTAIAFLIYSNTLSSSFHFDDYPAIVANPTIRQLSNLNLIFDSFNTRTLLGYSFALNYKLGGLNVTGYHVFNIFIHIFASFTLYKLVFVLFSTQGLSKFVAHRQRIALLSSLLFLIHPIQTQGVTYIWQRASSMAALFYLLSIFLYFKARIQSSRKYYILSFLTTLMALFTKETAQTLPITMVLCEIYFFGESPRPGLKKRVLFLLPFILTLVIIPLLLTRAPVIKSKIMKPETRMDISRFVGPRSMTRSDYMVTQLSVTKTYLRLLFFPIRQNLDYDYPLTRNLTAPNSLFSLLLIASLIALACFLYKKQRLLSFGILWFFLTLSIEAFVVQKDVIFEHRLYLPMAGFAMALASALVPALKRKWHFFILALIFTLLAGATYLRNEVWKDDISLWKDVVQKSPQKARGYSSLALAYYNKFDYKNALEYTKKALELDPRDPSTLNNLGNTYSRLGRLDEATEIYEKILQSTSDFGFPYYNLGINYSRKGMQGKALACFKKARTIDPYDLRLTSASNYFNHLGNMQNSEGKTSEAIYFYKLAIRMDPRRAKPLYNLANLYAAQGRTQKAILLYNKAIRANDHDHEIFTNLGNAYQKEGRFQEAITCFEKAISLAPKKMEAYFNLGNLYRQLDQPDKAIKYYEKAVKIRPDFTKTYDLLNELKSGASSKKPTKTIDAFK